MTAVDTTPITRISSSGHMEYLYNAYGMIPDLGEWQRLSRPRDMEPRSWTCNVYTFREVVIDPMTESIVSRNQLGRMAMVPSTLVTPPTIMFDAGGCRSYMDGRIRELLAQNAYTTVPCADDRLDDVLRELPALADKEWSIVMRRGRWAFLGTTTTEGGWLI